jgi:hypothetical protein
MWTTEQQAAGIIASIESNPAFPALLGDSD